MKDYRQDPGPVESFFLWLLGDLEREKRHRERMRAGDRWIDAFTRAKCLEFEQACEPTDNRAAAIEAAHAEARASKARFNGKD